MQRQELIDKVNAQCKYGQGIFSEPSGIPIHIKEHVVYTRYETGGASGGSFDDHYSARPYERDEPDDKWEVLDILLKELNVTVTFSQYKSLIEMVQDNTDSEVEYYGNYTNYRIEYIKLDDILNLFGLYYI